MIEIIRRLTQIEPDGPPRAPVVPSVAQDIKLLRDRLDWDPEAHAALDRIEALVSKGPTCTRQ